MQKSSAHRRYVLRVLVAMVGYIATIFLAEFFIEDRSVSGPPAWLLALLPGLCVASVFWAIGRLLIEEQDEYLRSLLVRQMLVATGLTMVIATIYGFLENYGLVGHIDAFYLTVLFFGGLGVGSIVNRLTVGDGGC
jgi:hypothetical protein